MCTWIATVSYTCSAVMDSIFSANVSETIVVSDVKLEVAPAVETLIRTNM